METQARLNPNRMTYEIHQYVAGHVEMEGFVVKMPKHKAKAIKAMSVYRVILTKALLRHIHKLPQWQKDIVFDSEDVDQVLDILDGCIEAAENTLAPEPLPKSGE